MIVVYRILGSAIGLAALGVALAGCGQRGPLYLPKAEAAKGRATLPDLLVPGAPRATEPAPPPDAARPGLSNPGSEKR